jgi:hypothetical protein
MLRFLKKKKIYLHGFFTLLCCVTARKDLNMYGSLDLSYRTSGQCCETGTTTFCLNGPEPEPENRKTTDNRKPTENGIQVKTLTR